MAHVDASMTPAPCFCIGSVTRKYQQRLNFKDLPFLQPVRKWMLFWQTIGRLQNSPAQPQPVIQVNNSLHYQSILYAKGGFRSCYPQKRLSWLRNLCPYNTDELGFRAWPKAFQDWKQSLHASYHTVWCPNHACMPQVVKSQRWGHCLEGSGSMAPNSCHLA